MLPALSSPYGCCIPAITLPPPLCCVPAGRPTTPAQDGDGDGDEWEAEEADRVDYIFFLLSMYARISSKLNHRRTSVLTRKPSKVQKSAHCRRSYLYIHQYLHLVSLLQVLGLFLLRRLRSPLPVQKTKNYSQTKVHRRGHFKPRVGTGICKPS